jgi:hypothetical protein
MAGTMETTSLQKAEELEDALKKEEESLTRAKQERLRLQPGLTRAVQAEKHDEEELERLKRRDEELRNEINQLSGSLNQTRIKLERAREAIPRNINAGRREAA